MKIYKVKFFSFFLSFLFLFSPEQLSSEIFIYVANNFNGTVTVIDGKSNSIVTTIDLLPSGQLPISIAVDQNHSHVLIGKYDRFSGDSSVSVIDMLTNTVIGDILLPNLSSPSGIAVSPNGDYAYVSNEGTNNVSKIDLLHLTNVGQIALSPSSGPTGIAITPDGLFAYTANANNGSVSAIDLTNMSVFSFFLPGQTFPESIAITPNGHTAYTVNSASNNVSVIDISTNTFLENITLVDGLTPQSIAITPNGLYAYAADFGVSNANVSRIDITNNIALSNIALSGAINAQGIAITPNGRYAYTANFNDTVSVVDLVNNLFLTNIDLPTGSSPIAVAVGRLFPLKQLTGRPSVLSTML